MELSLLVAKIFAIYLITVGTGILGGQLNISKMTKDLKDSQGLTFIAGLFTLVIGALLVAYHNIWIGPWWIVLITFLAWATLIKGIIMIAFPRVLFYYAGILKNVKPLLGLLPMAIGVMLGYFLLTS